LTLASLPSASQDLACAEWCITNLGLTTGAGLDCVAKSLLGQGPCYTCGPYKAISTEQLCSKACVNIASDPKNCGACGTSVNAHFHSQHSYPSLINLYQCPNDQCINGACQSAGCGGASNCTGVGVFFCGTSSDCICVVTAEGTNFCGDHTLSNTDTCGCTKSSDCPLGQVCGLGACCAPGYSVCVPVGVCGSANVKKMGKRGLTGSWDAQGLFGEVV